MPEVNLPVRDIDDVIGQIQVNGYHGWLLVLCGMGFCVDAMEVLALSFINPCAGAEFNLSDAQIASITSVVFVGELLGSMFWGPFADAYGRWNAYMYSVCFLVIGSWASGFSPSYSWLLFLRFLVGIGVGGNTVPFDIYAEFLPPEARGTRLT
jgi:MFS family permease